MYVEMEKKTSTPFKYFYFRPITLGSKCIGYEFLFGLLIVVFGPPHCGFTK
jgi:hypothetical protein